MLLPICLKPYPGELLYGWLTRLREANGFGSMRVFQDHYFAPKLVPYDTRYKTRIDYLFSLDLICERYRDIASFPGVPFILEKMTPLPAVLPSMRYGYQAEKLQMILRTRTEGVLDIKPKTDDVGVLRICPHCMKEDRTAYGEAYFHAEHHLPGVRVCTKHRSPLQKVVHNGKESLTESADWKTETVALKASLDVELAFSIFMERLWRACPMTDLCSFQKSLLKRMEELGYATVVPYGSLAEDIEKAGFGGLFLHGQVGKLRRLLVGEQPSAEELMALAAFLFRECKTTEICFGSDTDDFEISFRELIKGRYKIRSDFGMAVCLECMKCGRVFYIHPYALSLGCGCPHCDEALKPDAVVERQLKYLGDGEYSMVSPFRGYGDRTAKILHRICGKIRTMRPAEAVWMQTECVCAYRPDVKEIQKRLGPSLSKEFEIKEYEGVRTGGQKIRVLHHACGREFQVPFVNFMNNPYCRACRPRKYSAEQFIRDFGALTGDDYEILSPFVDQQTKITVRHKKCGTTTTALPVAFLNGKRCNLCTAPLTETEVAEMVSEGTGGFYRVKERNKAQYCVTGEDGSVVWKDVRYISQELLRPTPSKLFKKRVKIPVRKERNMAVIYLAAKEACGEKGYWVAADFKHQGITECGKRNAVIILTKNGYLERVGYGKYVAKTI